MKISSSDLLPIGTRVQANSRRGTIVKAIWHHHGAISLHTIEYTEKCRSIKNKMTWVKMDKPETSECNYSFIETL